jgi:hypothetical protein
MNPAQTNTILAAKSPAAANLCAPRNPSARPYTLKKRCMDSPPDYADRGS